MAEPIIAQRGGQVRITAVSFVAGDPPAGQQRCLEWLTRFRRLVRRHERIGFHYLGLLRLACALICYRRADRLGLLASNNSN
ncbi:hypothetical protein [Actinoplanes aureus]|uniref:Transposase n=1 Tax=Actinoplanes aureus TaxID=2792083 RepID=A0A931FZE7_9ACTN|nr:hypothetical protein [Actinoplanes aureus]MBG0564687.1 hypothetical protein [Actinoplanes aureus]